MTSPRIPVPATLAVFTKAILGFWSNSVIVQSVHSVSLGQVVQGVGSVEVAVTGSPTGGVPLAMAKL